MTDQKYAQLVTTQSYGSQQTIDGVELQQLSWQSDDGGNFSELVRITDGKVQGQKSEFEARQVSISFLTPQAIKAYHLHNEQDDLWYVPPTDRLLVNLHDVRQGSPTFDVHMRLILGAGKNQLLRIPHGVAHGIANMYDRQMVLFYLTNQQFNSNQPDEHRLPWDTFGADVWSITKG